MYFLVKGRITVVGTANANTKKSKLQNLSICPRLTVK